MIDKDKINYILASNLITKTKPDNTENKAITDEIDKLFKKDIESGI